MTQTNLQGSGSVKEQTVWTDQQWSLMMAAKKYGLPIPSTVTWKPYDRRHKSLGASLNIMGRLVTVEETELADWHCWHGGEKVSVLACEVDARKNHLVVSQSQCLERYFKERVETRLGINGVVISRDPNRGTVAIWADDTMLATIAERELPCPLAQLLVGSKLEGLVASWRDYRTFQLELASGKRARWWGPQDSIVNWEALLHAGQQQREVTAEMIDTRLAQGLAELSVFGKRVLVSSDELVPEQLDQRNLRGAIKVVVQYVHPDFGWLVVSRRAALRRYVDLLRIGDQLSGVVEGVGGQGYANVRIGNTLLAQLPHHLVQSALLPSQLPDGLFLKGLRICAINPNKLEVILSLPDRKR